MTQNNLGNALYSLGDREGGTERLEKAVQAYQLALEELTPETSAYHNRLATENLTRVQALLDKRLKEG
jgi:hypothetical protein